MSAADPRSPNEHGPDEHATSEHTTNEHGDRAAAPPVILVLEDDPMILMDLSIALEDEGAAPLSAMGASEALALIDANRPVAAVLDVNLGRGRTCKEVADRLAALHVPFVLHSGDLDRQGELIASIDAEIVPKPTPSHLVAQRVLALTGR